MRTLFAIIVVFTLPLAATAQTAPKVATPSGQPPASTTAPQPAVTAGPPAFYPDSPTKVFALRYVDSRSIERLLTTFGVPVSRESSLNAIAVKAPEKTLNAVEEVIKRFDVPANALKKVEITAYLLLGSSQSEADSVPAPVRPVVDQLRNVMTYKSYRTLDTLIMNGREGDYIREDGVIPKLSDTDTDFPTYDFRVLPRVTVEGAEQYIHLENLILFLNVHLAGRPSPSELTISTFVDIKKGQQIVVGKATVQDRAVVLVLSAKVVD